MSWLQKSEFMQAERERKAEGWIEKEMSHCGDVIWKFDPLTKSKTSYRLKCGVCEDCRKRKIYDFFQQIDNDDFVYFTETSDGRRQLHRRLGKQDNYLSYPYYDGFVTFSPQEVDGAVNGNDFVKDFDYQKIIMSALFDKSRYNKSGTLRAEPTKKEKIPKEYKIKVNTPHYYFASGKQFHAAMLHANRVTYDLLPDANNIQEALDILHRHAEQYATEKGYVYKILRRTEKWIDGSRIDWSIGRDLWDDDMSHLSIQDHSIEEDAIYTKSDTPFRDFAAQSASKIPQAKQRRLILDPA